MINSKHSQHILTSYYAPRGRNRIYDLGIEIAQQYLSPADQLIGIIGEAGSGKSMLIKGMFPGLELTNDDAGVNIRPLPLLDQDEEVGFFTPHTYHLDIRFEQGFTQMAVLADAINQAVSRGKRVIIEHFDLIYPFLGRNANLLIGVGEQILISRPNIFGPEPKEIYDAVYASLPYRLMSHSAEDLCEFCMPKGEVERCQHADVKHGFILAFYDHAPDFDLYQLEKQVQELIGQQVSIDYCDESHITIGGKLHYCTGPRTHVRHAGQIKGFQLLKHFIYDKDTKRYLMVGVVGENSTELLKQLDVVEEEPNPFANMANDWIF